MMQRIARRHPCPDDLHRVWLWEVCPFGGGPSSARAIACHEAGHIVYAQWIGMGTRQAEIHSTGGEMTPVIPDFGGIEEPKEGDGTTRACAAGLFHAGLAAELLLFGIQWRGPIHRPRQTDHQKAEEMLSVGMGVRTVPGHAYAQLLALHILDSRWAEVSDIAGKLLETGRWQPEGATT